MKRDRILLAVTMGDPAGVGPEVIAGSWAAAGQATGASRFVVGRTAAMRAAIELLSRGPLQNPRTALSTSDVSRIGFSPMEVVAIQTPDQVLDLPPDCLPVMEVGSDQFDHVAPGRNSAGGGEIAFQAIQRATSLALEGAVDGIVTAPISKTAMHLAGHTQWPGHTELLAALCGVPQTAMMLYLSPRCPLIQSPGGLGVIHTTLHISLKSAIDGLTESAILETARLASGFAQQMLAASHTVREARVGIAALNPHAGEDGMFGDEESRIIAPAVKQGRSEGLPLFGPFPCDTLMHRAAEGEFDCVVAMYHDQGHIALKLLGLHHAVNVTLGLPIIRTSVAHGTAFDLAWQGRARSSSMLEAIQMAADLAGIRHRNS